MELLNFVNFKEEKDPDYYFNMIPDIILCK